MAPGRYYMHKKSMDVCYYVERRFRIDLNRYSVKLEPWNLGYSGTPWRIDSARRFEIDNMDEWVNITDKIYNKRTKAGLP
jgi:hypothetical protein